MDKLREIVKACMSSYAVEGINVDSYLVYSAADDVFSVLYASHDKTEDVDVGLFVQLAGEQIIIVRDQNSKPLYEMLLNNGVPRQQIVLAYAGESADTTIDETA